MSHEALERALRDGPLPLPSPSARRRAVELFGLHPRLLQDSAQPRETAGLRGEATARRLLYRVGDLEVDLRLEPRPGGTALRGDLLDLSASADPRPVAGCRVRVPGGGEALTDEAGAFLLEGAGTDPWLVEFAWRGRTIRIALSDPTAPPQ